MYYSAYKRQKKKNASIERSRYIQETQKFQELITLFNTQSSCINYKRMKHDWLNLAKYAVNHSSEDEIPQPSPFTLSSFTLVDLDNFAHDNSLSGTKYAHDTSITLFQEIP